MTGGGNLEERKAYHKSFTCPSSKELIDKGLVIWFKGPRSYTGEDVAEFHLHGSRAVIKQMISVLSSFEGIRASEPGEFTRRSFFNGKMDLCEVEGVADLINSDTIAQKKMAQRILNGELSQKYQDWREKLISCLAHLEAFIDFAEDDDLDVSLAQVRKQVDEMIKDMEHFLQTCHRGDKMKHGLELVIAGPPNAGKSSLINWLAKRQVSIVSPTPGTTRDVIEREMDVGGYPVVIADTAGIRSSTVDDIETQGIAMATKRIQSSDIKLFVFDIADFGGEGISQNIMHFLPYMDKHSILVINKADLLTKKGKTSLHVDQEGREVEDLKSKVSQLFDDLQSPHQDFILSAIPILIVSCHTHQGLDSLFQSLEYSVKYFFEQQGSESGLILTNSRHKEKIQECVKTLLAFQAKEKQVELAAEEMRHAIHHIGCITGKIYTNDILDKIFSDFCIGK